MKKRSHVRPRLNIERIRKLSDYCLKNASELVHDARVLLGRKRYARAFFLSMVALEETAKRDILWKAILIGDDKKQWNEFWKEFLSHKTKLSRVLQNHISINPNTDKYTPVEIIDKYLQEIEKTKTDANLFDLAKQLSLYVDIVEEEPNLPSRQLKKRHASEVLAFAEANLEYHRSFKPTDEEIEAVLNIKKKMKEDESFIDYWHRTHAHSESEKDS